MRSPLPACPLALLLFLLSLSTTLFTPHGTLVRASTSTPNTGDQLQGFTFAYSSANLVLPIVPTCPTPLTLTQLTPTNAGGPDPVAPYTLVVFAHEQLMDGANIAYERIYAATLNVGDMSKVRDIQHPFANGTQFIGCIWSSNGVSGGCQDLITVVPNDATAAAYASSNSTCRTPSVMGSWVTPPGSTLDVDIQAAAGTVSTNAWPSSCSDLKFTPKNGTAPYTLVIAPAFHPPVNISSSGSSDNSMNYTVRLTHGQAFMAGLFDSAGNSWAIGPLHAGHSDDLKCLAVATGQKQAGGGGSFGVGALAGGIVGAFVVGAIGAYFLAWWIGRRGRTHKRASSAPLDPYADPRPASYRHNSGFSTTSYTKPLNTFSTSAYTDMTPPMGFDTPETLYDPSPQQLSKQQAGYPAPPPNKRDSRPFPKPPDSGGYPIPFDTQAAYNEHVMTDFAPQPQAHLRDESGSGQGHGRDRSGSDHHGNVRNVSPASMHRGGGSGSGGRAGRGRGQGVSGGPASPSPRQRSFHDDDDDSDDDSGGEGADMGSPGRRARNVYVVHADAGGADMHIHLPNRSNVIELPPNYREDPRLNNPLPNLPNHPSLPNLLNQPAQPNLHGPPNIPNPNISPRPGSIHSFRSQQDRAHSPLQPLRPGFELQPARSRGSGFSEMTDEEIRARAEAALAEKQRFSVPRPQ